MTLRRRSAFSRQFYRLNVPRGHNSVVQSEAEQAPTPVTQKRSKSLFKSKSMKTGKTEKSKSQPGKSRSNKSKVEVAQVCSTFSSKLVRYASKAGISASLSFTACQKSG